jgi:integrase
VGSPFGVQSEAADFKGWDRGGVAEDRVAAQIEDVRMHDLRHTVGTFAGQSGANAFLVRDLLRHKNLAMTGRYVNRADSPVRTLSDQVGERIASAIAGRKPADVVPLNAING